MPRVMAKHEKDRASFTRMVHPEARCHLIKKEARLQRNLHHPEPEELIADLWHLVDNPGSICTSENHYTNTLNLFWYMKTLLSQAISDSAT